MSSQFELRARIPDEMADLLDGYFYEIESAHWGVMQKEINDPYEVFGIFADAVSRACRTDGTTRRNSPRCPRRLLKA